MNTYEKYLTEGEEQVIYEADNMELKQVADNFTRYLMGDPQSAISGLSKLKGKDLGIYVETGNNKEYNDQYNKLYKKIYKVISEG